MKTIQLTENDYAALVMMLGYAAGAHLKMDTPLPAAFGQVTDWILIQGGNEATYTYWNDRDKLKEQKEKEIAAELEGK